MARAAAAAAAMTLLPASAANAPFRLELDPRLFSEDDCLAPAFDAPNCPVPTPSAAGDSRPTASAALLAPDLPDPAPRLAVDESVFQLGTEVTY
jgi:hypothetical protein